MIAGFKKAEEHQTQRHCIAHPKALAIGFVYKTDLQGSVDRSSRMPACIECARAAGYKEGSMKVSEALAKYYSNPSPYKTAWEEFCRLHPDSPLLRASDPNAPILFIPFNLRPPA
jgi:hypothetical protein